MPPTAEKVKSRGPRPIPEAAPASAAERELKPVEPLVGPADPEGPTGVREAGSQIAAAMLEAADPSTGEHSDDVELVVAEICRRLRVNAHEREDILVAARLHDVGKVAIPREVLEKDGPLDESEWELIKDHTVIGERILRSVPELGPAAKLVRHSHEHFDGSGYPDGLKGKRIPLGSRIILCADAFHAIRSDRPYRKGRTTRTAMKEMRRCSGSQFDPRVVEALDASVNGAKRNGRRKLPPRLAVLFAVLAIGGGGAYAAERGWVPSPVPGLGPERSADETGDAGDAASSAAGAATTSDDDSVAGTDEASGENSGDADSPGSSAERRRGRGLVSVNAAGRGQNGNDRPGRGSGGAQGTFGSAGGDAGGSAGSGAASGPSSGGSTGGGSAGGGASGSSGSGSGASPGSSSAPGQSGSTPGQSGSTPGQSGTTPGQSGNTPAGGGAPPGQAGTAPGLSGSTPGQSGTAPGQSGGAPGNSGSPPGLSASSPGNSGNAPGQGGAGGNPNG